MVRGQQRTESEIARLMLTWRCARNIRRSAHMCTSSLLACVVCVLVVRVLSASCTCFGPCGFQWQSRPLTMAVYFILDGDSFQARVLEILECGVGRDDKLFLRGHSPSLMWAEGNGRLQCGQYVDVCLVVIWI